MCVIDVLLLCHREVLGDELCVLLMYCYCVTEKYWEMSDVCY